ncbi:MAG: DinB family protein [Myxococcales bacterium]
MYKRGGREQEHPLWWALAHLFNHQTHYRGQITTFLTQLGIDPGVTDPITMLREAR